MIPKPIENYLNAAGIGWKKRSHPAVVDAQKLAQTMHVSGHRLAKSVLCEVDGASYICVLPASERVDLPRLCKALAGFEARLLEESEFAELFPGCEIGAEPPFGRLYGLPVIVDRALTRADNIVMRAGSHRECVEMKYDAFAKLEAPIVAQFGVPAARRTPATESRTTRAW